MCRRAISFRQWSVQLGHAPDGEVENWRGTYVSALFIWIFSRGKAAGSHHNTPDYESVITSVVSHLRGATIAVHIPWNGTLTSTENLVRCRPRSAAIFPPNTTKEETSSNLNHVVTRRILTRHFTHDRDTRREAFTARHCEARPRKTVALDTRGYHADNIVWKRAR